MCYLSEVRVTRSGAAIPRLRLTKSLIDDLPVLSKDTVYWDAGVPGFGVKVTPKGRRVFIVMYRLAGAGSRLRKYTIGPYGRITLPMARAQAQKILPQDWMGVTQLRKRNNHGAASWSIKSTISSKDLFRSMSPRVGTSKRLTNLLRRDVIPYWGTKSIHEIKKRDVSDLVSLIAQRNAHASHRLLKTLKTFFKWCVGRAVIDFSPTDGLTSGYRETSRDRVLTDQELAAIILGARKMPHPYRGIVEFLALTGQRREEVAQLTRNELDEKARIWIIPSSRTKNKKAHIVHLSGPAWKVVAKTPEGELVFGTLRGKRFQAFGKGKRALDKLFRHHWMASGQSRKSSGSLGDGREDHDRP